MLWICCLKPGTPLCCEENTREYLLQQRVGWIQFLDCSTCMEGMTRTTLGQAQERGQKGSLVSRPPQNHLALTGQLWTCMSAMLVGLRGVKITDVGDLVSCVSLYNKTIYRTTSYWDRSDVGGIDIFSLNTKYKRFQSWPGEIHPFPHKGSEDALCIVWIPKQVQKEKKYEVPAAIR